jgi:hypothetical protein
VDISNGTVTGEPPTVEAPLDTPLPAGEIRAADDFADAPKAPDTVDVPADGAVPDTIAATIPDEDEDGNAVPSAAKSVFLAGVSGAIAHGDNCSAALTYSLDELNVDVLDNLPFSTKGPYPNPANAQVIYMESHPDEFAPVATYSPYDDTLPSRQAAQQQIIAAGQIAQKLADQGYIVIATYKNPNGLGHVAMVVPEWNLGDKSTDGFPAVAGGSTGHSVSRGELTANFAFSLPIRNGVVNTNPQSPPVYYVYRVKN